MFFPYNQCNNLPIMLPDWTESHPQLDDVDVHALVEQIDQVNQILDDQNLNLTKEEKELLLWHQRLGHVGFTWIQTLMRPAKHETGAPPDPPTIPVKLKGASKCIPPKCVACSLAKQHRKTSGSSRIHHKPEMEMAIRRNNLQPGECVSIDQYVCRTPGRLAHTFGKEDHSIRYTGGTIFVVRVIRLQSVTALDGITTLGLISIPKSSVVALSELTFFSGLRLVWRLF